MKLEGIRVLDFSLFLPGPLLTQMMADQGAEVIKIESLGEGEPNRHIGLKRDGVTVYFANTHRGKKSLTLNLKEPEAIEIVMRLAEHTDVIVEGFRPGVAKRLGIDYDAVRRRAPGIVYASLSAFGQTGPYVQRPAHDPAVQGLIGAISVNQGQDGKPTLSGVQIADMLNATMSLSGIMMALYRREKTAKGDFLDMAMMDCVIAAMPNNMGTMFAEDRAPIPKHERTWGGYAMMSVYETKDGKHIVLGGAEEKFARNLLVALGREDLIALCAGEPGPGQDPARAFFRDVFKTKTRDEWSDWFDGRDICYGPVNDLKEALEDPQLLHREMVLTDDRGWRHLGIPIKFQDEPGRVDFECPGHGAQTEEIIARLGYEAAAIKVLREKGVC